jgi:predicted nucleic acid-binding protein
MKFWLLDTGPIVAFLDASDSQHEHVAGGLDKFTGRFVTTSAVIVEAMHFVSRSPFGPALLIEFLLQSQTLIHECTALNDLAMAAELMAEYADTPMDFADATLVLLASRLKIFEVCTLDRRGFRTYRVGRKSFRLVLDKHE